MYQGERDIAFIETFDEVFDPSLSASRGRWLMLSAKLVLVQQESLQNSSMFPWCSPANPFRYDLSGRVRNLTFRDVQMATNLRPSSSDPKWSSMQVVLVVTEASRRSMTRGYSYWYTCPPHPTVKDSGGVAPTKSRRFMPE